MEENEEMNEIKVMQEEEVEMIDEDRGVDGLVVEEEMEIVLKDRTVL